MKKTLMIAATLALVSGSAQAWESLIARHYGAANPTNENWSLNEWAGTVSTWGHSTDPAWVISDNDGGGGVNYNFLLDDATQTNMTANGWKLTVDAKSQWTKLNSAAMVSVPTQQGVYQLKFGKVAGEQVVQLYNFVTNSLTLVGAVTNAVDDYHVTELVYDGNASGFVDMFFDGAEVFSNVTSSGAGHYPFFGSGSSADIGEGRYREVTLENYSGGSVIVSHVGAADPTSEGWNRNAFAGVVNLWGHGTDPAWVVSDNDSGGGANYNFFLSDAAQTNMSNYGWKLTVDAKSQWTTLNSAAMVSVPSLQGIYQLKLGKVAGEQVIQLWTASGSLSLYGAVTNAIDDYHVTELVYDGNSAGGVDMFVDGIQVFSNVTSSGGGNYPFFGSGSSADKGEGRYRKVELRTLSGKNTIVSGSFSIGYGVDSGSGWSTNEYGAAWDSDVGSDFELKHEFTEPGGGFSDNGPTFVNGILESGVPGDYSRMVRMSDAPLSFAVTGQYIGSALSPGATNVTTTLVIDNVSIYGYRNEAAGEGDVSTWWSEGSVTSSPTTIITNHYGWGNAGLWKPIKWNPEDSAMAGSDQVVRTFTMNVGDGTLVSMEGFEISGHIELSYVFLTSGGTPYWWLEQQNPAWTNDYETVAATDHDGDGALTGDEYFAGTDPNDPNSAFALEMIDHVISFDTVEATMPPPGRLPYERRYSLESTTSLITVPWQSLPGYTNILGTGQTVIYTNTPSSDTDFFIGRVWLGE